MHDQCVFRHTPIGTTIGFMLVALAIAKARLGACERAIGIKISDAELINALRCRRTVSVCTVLKGAKRGRFAYLALILTPMCERDI
jgi:hypothetical protein